MMIRSKKPKQPIALGFAIVGLAFNAGYSQAHETDEATHATADHCALVKTSAEEAGFSDCYDVETKTVTNAGVLKSGVYCR